MIEFLKSLPSIIKEASKTKLGTLSLMTLLLFFITLTFFQDEGTLVQLLIFFLLFLVLILFGLSVHQLENTKQIADVYNSISEHPGEFEKLSRPVTLRNWPKYVVGGLIFMSISAFTTYNILSHEHFLYYESFDRTKSRWIGLNEITASVANHRNNYFRFTFRGRLGKLKSAEYLNGSGVKSIEQFQDILEKPGSCFG